MSFVLWDKKSVSQTTHSVLCLYKCFDQMIKFCDLNKMESVVYFLYFISIISSDDTCVTHEDIRIKFHS